MNCSEVEKLRFSKGLIISVNYRPGLSAHVVACTTAFSLACFIFSPRVASVPALLKFLLFLKKKIKSYLFFITKNNLQTSQYYTFFSISPHLSFRNVNMFFVIAPKTAIAFLVCAFVYTKGKAVRNSNA